MTFSRKTVILAAGDYPTHPVPLAALESASHIICCDSATESLLAHGLRPDAIVGDLDSVSSAVKEAYKDIVHHILEQDFNDLHKAFRYAISVGWNDIVILGATGKREDHTLGNISYLADFDEESPGVAMLTDTGLFRVIRAPGGELDVKNGAPISFFCFDPGNPVDVSGVEYAVDNLKFPRLRTATLNRAAAGKIKVSTPSAPVIVYTTW